MSHPDRPSDAVPATAESDRRRGLARRVAQAHAELDDGTLLAVVSGSVVENLADARSDIDMGIALDALPGATRLQAACAASGGGPWIWSAGDLAEGGLVVAFLLEGIEVQIAYTTHARMQAELDDVLLAHNPDTPQHKLAEGLLKAEALAGAPRLDRLKQRLADFPPGLAQAMVAFWVREPTPWRAITQIVHRDAALWCRELLVEAGWRQLGLLAGLNHRYFTRFQLKRMHKLAASFALAPPRLAERLQALLEAPLPAAFDALHALEGEVLALVAAHMPAVDVGAAVARRAGYRPGG